MLCTCIHGTYLLVVVIACPKYTQVCMVVCEAHLQSKAGQLNTSIHCIRDRAICVDPVYDHNRRIGWGVVHDKEPCVRALP